MQDNHLFEYATIRVVPKVEREEFLNVGVVLYCKSQRFLSAMYSVDEIRLSVLCPALDIEELRKHLISFGKICAGDQDAGPIAALDLPSRFRWLTAKRSTIIQTSGVHPGLTQDAMKTLHRLHEQLVSC